MLENAIAVVASLIIAGVMVYFIDDKFGGDNDDIVQ
jgi:hypothetical protein